MDDSRLLQESNLAARAANHVMTQATTSDGLAQVPYVAARVGFEPTTSCTEGTEHHHLATTYPLNVSNCGARFSDGYTYNLGGISLQNENRRIYPPNSKVVSCKSI